MRANARQEGAGEILERFAHMPVTFGSWRDIGEKSQDAAAAHRARWKSVNVQKPVIADFGIAAALDLDRAVRGAGAFDIAVGEKLLHQVGRLSAEAFDHGRELIGLLAGERGGLHLAGIVIQRDVLGLAV
jgi:hypothetical protein